MKIKKGDNILVIQGREKGKTGKITSVDPLAGTIKVSGINIGKKHVKARGKRAAGGVTEVAMPLPISKVMFMCSHCNKPVRLGNKITSAGNKERVCKLCKSTV